VTGQATCMENYSQAPQRVRGRVLGGMRLCCAGGLGVEEGAVRWRTHSSFPPPAHKRHLFSGESNSIVRCADSWVRCRPAVCVFIEGTSRAGHDKGKVSQPSYTQQRNRGGGFLGRIFLGGLVCCVLLLAYTPPAVNITNT
jgi:hypothetical protein